jgi:hypothetical protein
MVIEHDPELRVLWWSIRPRSPRQALEPDVVVLGINIPALMGLRGLGNPGETVPPFRCSSRAQGRAIFSAALGTDVRGFALRTRGARSVTPSRQ